MGAFKLSITACVATAQVPYLRRHLRLAFGLIENPPSELSVVLVNDRTMAVLHLRFLGIAGPTDVLTFPIEQNSSGRVTSGEVYVCVPEARRRVGSGRSALQNELLLYALHGLLHLSGFDDRTDRDFRRMHRTEDEILSTLGVGPVFNRPTEAE